MQAQHTAKRIDPKAYNALADALAVIYFNKRPWARYLRGVLRDVPELLSGLDFEGPTKRETSGELIDRLLANEHKYQAVTISLMLNVASMDSFPNLAEHENAAEKIAVAEAAVAELRKWTQYHQSIADEHARYAAEMAEASEQASRNRAFSESIRKLKDQFLAMHGNNSNPQKRGKDFEVFLNQLFGLYDLEPRAAYSLEHEQIDGAFSFDTDDYILEARWWQEPIGRDHLDVFKAKVERKGKNALGLYVSISSFTQGALKKYSDSTPFITMDGVDILTVLEEGVRLDDLLQRKKRHANETGECYFPASRML